MSVEKTPVKLVFFWDYLSLIPTYVKLHIVKFAISYLILHIVRLSGISVVRLTPEHI